MASDSLEYIKKTVSLDPSLRVEEFSAFHKEVKLLMKQSRYEEAATAVKGYTYFNWNFTTLKSLHKTLKILKKELPRGDNPVKVAVVSNFYTTTQFTWFINLFLFTMGFEIEVYEADYGVMKHELISDDSGLYGFSPDIVILLTSVRDINNFPAIGSSKKEIEAILENEAELWTGLWNKINSKLKCQIIQNVFEAPLADGLGHFAVKEKSSRTNYVMSLNNMLIDKSGATGNIIWHNINQLASTIGRPAWHSTRFYYDSKLPCGPEFINQYAYSVASIIRGCRGKSKKVLVLDLDNTLWGGVIGDDGLGGISLSQGDPLGEAYLEFQQYILTLKERGILLAVCSKNEMENARLPFQEHPDMVLKLDDFSCFKANWNDKAGNIQEIARELNLGLDSVVFVDDNPSERALVRRMLPAVSVPELTGDPSGFINCIENERFFELVALSEEDIKRSKMYAENARRKLKKASVDNIDNYLKSINMQCICDPVNEVNKERVVQLINKSNQFNFTTKRYSDSEIQHQIDSPGHFGLTYRLLDDFGDNGLIAIVLLEQKDKVLEIDTWVMSCRVLSRGMEQFTLNTIYNLARKNKIETIKGLYIPTKKNRLVKNLYSDLGFRKTGETSGESTEWSLSLQDVDPEKWQNYISEVKK